MDVNVMNDQSMQDVSPDFLSALNLQEDAPDPCIIVVFGASGDLTKRLLIPSLFNLYCDGLLPDFFAILGMAMDDYTTESFRVRMSTDVQKYSRQEQFDETAWANFCDRIHYLQARFDDADAFVQLKALLQTLDTRYSTDSNVLFYMATPPAVFGMISSGLESIGMNAENEGWRRIIVEKPFGMDLSSALSLNEEILSYWKEQQVYRIDHYLGKETVQNLLAFRFANGMFEPLWNRTHIDHIQITATEQVGVEWRGGYYDKSGVMRDMIQNHLFQMMAYLCMEPPTTFDPEAIRNEKYKLLSAVRILKPEEVRYHAVRGQYDEGVNLDGSPAKAYRDEHLVDPHSNTETYAALKLRIDNWRWHGVPVFLRSGKGLRTKSTEIVVQFRRAPEFTFRGTPASSQLEANQLIFRIQPNEGIEIRFLAKRPGPSMHMRKVNMNFEYDEAFSAHPGTGYETMLYDCMRGDASLFSRSDLVETSWRIVQPVLDVWGEERARDFPNYPFGSWGPKAAFSLPSPDHRRWLARTPKQALERVPMFEGSSKTMINAFAMMLKPVVFNAGDEIARLGTEGRELYIIEMGSVDVIDPEGNVVTTLSGGQVFGELSLLVTKERRASVRAVTYCALYMMEKRDFCKVLMDRPHFAQKLMQVARERYNVIVDAHEWLDSEG
ncbi:glucose-6-phosphate 1-dehydrogenase [Mariprofundus ferrooxydans PV-1]|uniref:Glucose-6-phosphate 1-dehydrogenase n=2 Tax=Mariprofundus ferrooxydans TaxID=314344 RepID=Q0F2T2_9PROT|nr:glucose-6-phosphate 1-dehydrogenase [Mariprofundus ferrooxydans PV-1]